MDSIHYSELVKTVTLLVRTNECGLHERFKIELYRDSEGYFPIVYRLECFSIQQGCGNADKHFWDAHVFAIDIAEEWTQFRGDTIDGLLKTVVDRVYGLFRYCEEGGPP